MNKRTRLVLVNYLNTLPLLKGIRMEMEEPLEIIEAKPADCASILIGGKADYGLVPIGALIDQDGWRRVTNIGIGCRGEVETVCLFGNTPIETWDTIFLDYHSRTSVILTRYLVKNYWNSKAVFKAAYPDFENEIDHHTGGLIIGDRAFHAKNRFKYSYDLGAAWMDKEGLPFVFAIWASFQPENRKFEINLEAALHKGLGAIDPIVAQYQPHHPDINLKHYYTQSIAYILDEDMIEGMNRFCKIAHSMALTQH
jgi:chorismate dehydratase